MGSPCSSHRWGWGCVIISCHPPPYTGVSPPQNKWGWGFPPCTGGRVVMIYSLSTHNHIQVCALPPPPKRGRGWRRGLQPPTGVMGVITLAHLRPPLPHIQTCFVDFRKAIDKKNHLKLLYKLRQTDIGSLAYNKRKDMYISQHQAIQVNVKNLLSDKFPSNIGVSKGTVFTLFYLTCI